MKKEVLLYSRVSTDDQAQNGHSLRFQKDALYKYCEDNEINKEQIIYYQKDGCSGKSFNRPQIKKVIYEIKMDFVEKIVFLSLDR